MTRLTGIRILALSVALWAVAVWLLGAPPPAARESVAENGAGTATVAAGETGTGAGTAAEDPSLRTGATVTPEAGTAPPAPEPAAGGSGVPATAAATAPDSDTAGAAPATGVPATAPDAGTEGLPADAGGAAAPPVPTRPDTQHELPMPRLLPPAGAPAPRPDGTLADESAVASQLDAARRAAWEGRLEDALTHYRAAARIQPRSHVLWGEMGNVLWAMRRWPEAAYALEGAAVLLVDAGELRAASDLLPAVGRIDPEAAHRVQRRLWIASQRQPE